MSHWIDRDTLILRSHRYWIDDIECRFVCREEISGLRYRYKFKPIEGRKRATIVLTENKMFNNPKVKYLDPEEEQSMASSYRISVICRQRSDGITVYQASVEWEFVSQFFGFEDATLPPEERAQRILKPSHAKKIKKYLLNTADYYLPPMIASVEVEGEIKFIPVKNDAGNGFLELPMSAVFRIIDGQHRTFAIREIMQSKEAVNFKNRFISVDLIANASLQLRQAIFRDVNTLGMSVSKNLTTVYSDHPDAIFANAVLDDIPIFRDQFTEKELTLLTNKSDKLFIYKHLCDATIKMKPKMGDELDFKFCRTFWEDLSEAIIPWMDVLHGKSTPGWVREKTVCSHGVAIQAFGELGKYLGEAARLSGNLNVHANLLSKLAAIDWHKDNPDLLNRVLDVNGKILSRRSNVCLLVNLLKVSIGVPVSGFTATDRKLELTHIGNLDLFS